MKTVIEMARIAGARDDGRRFEFELRDLEFLVELVRADERARMAEQPAQQEPLTDEQREAIAKGWRGRNWTVGNIIDAVEAAHGIKENT